MGDVTMTLYDQLNRATTTVDPRGDVTTIEHFGARPIFELLGLTAGTPQVISENKRKVAEGYLPEVIELCREVGL